MNVEHAKELEALERHVERVLELFPWQSDGPTSEGGGMQTSMWNRMRTPQEVATENRLRALRAGLRGALEAINSYRASG